MSPNAIPSQASVSNEIRFGVDVDVEKIKEGDKYPALLKVYYGRDKVTSANMYLKIIEVDRR
jgi:hypothetical protein